MAIAYTGVTGSGSTGGSNTCAATFGSGVTSGNFIIVLIGTYVASAIQTPTCADTGSNSYTRVVLMNNSTTETGDDLCGGAIFWAPITTGGTLTVTVSGMNGAHSSMRVMEFSGLAASPFDVGAAARYQSSAHGGASTTSWTSGSTATTAQADELVIGLVTRPSNSDIYSLDASYGATELFTGNVNSISAGYKIVSATGTYAFNGTASSAYAWFGAAVATFKADTGGGGGGSLGRLVGGKLTGGGLLTGGVLTAPYQRDTWQRRPSRLLWETTPTFGSA